jgi:hypothetical protein
MDDLPVREELDRRRENEMPNRSKTERGKKRKNKKRKCIGCAGVPPTFMNEELVSGASS